MAAWSDALVAAVVKAGGSADSHVLVVIATPQRLRWKPTHGPAARLGTERRRRMPSGQDGVPSVASASAKLISETAAEDHRFDRATVRKLELPSRRNLLDYTRLVVEVERCLDPFRCPFFWSAPRRSLAAAYASNASLFS